VAISSGVALSVLDTVPVWEGSTPTHSLRNMIDLAQRVEQFGYRRYWVAEHHNTLSIASSSPPVLVAELANATSTLRVGSGGVMLPNHSPLIVAEQFGTLEALHPGRIDLGVGRAPGTDPVTAQALRRTSDDVEGTDFPSRLTELMDYFAEPAADDSTATSINTVINAVPAAGNRPSMWLLGTSESSAQLAGKLGLPYAYAHHINPENVGRALAAYRTSFTPSVVSTGPHVIVAALVIAADTQAHAEWLSSSLGMMIVRMRAGWPQGPHTPPETAAVHPYSPAERQLIRERMSSRIIGGVDTVRRRVADLLDATQADELMAITLIHDQVDRVRCYQILADAVGTR
jgi:luciferase family oxidoreductase group 1